MKRNLLASIYCITFLLFLQTNAFSKESCLLVPISLEQKAEQSTLIVEGKVIGQQSFWDQGHQRIYTSNIIELYKIFKGNTSWSKIEIITEGGTVGNQKMEFTSTLTLSVGQNGIFFCMPHNVKGSGANMAEASFMVYSSLQGFVHYSLTDGMASDPFNTYKRIADARTAITNVTKKDYRNVKPVNNELERAEKGSIKSKTTAVPVIASFLPLATPGGIGALLTITGVNFGTVQGTGFVEFPNSSDGGATFVKPIASDYVSWSDVQIVVKVPSSVVTPAGCAGTGNIKVTNSDPNTGTSIVPLTITYAWTNLNDNGVAVRGDLVNDNTTGGYTFQYYTAFSTNAPATAAFQRAISSWCPTQVNWIIGAASAVNIAAADGVNIVRFDVGAELPAGVLGRLTSYYTGCSIGGPITWYVNEMDCVFDDGANWQFGPTLPTAAQYDFESVALHELGHGVQLNHVINNLDVMHYAIANGQTKRILNVDDLAGGNNVTSTSILPNVCGSAPMTLLPCPLAVQITSFNGKYLADEGASLEWVVSAEEDIDGYRVEKSLDGVQFETIAYVKSTNKPQDIYNYLDKTYAGEAFYRLTVVETNASLWATKIVHLRTKDAGRDLFVYPNPTRGSITFSASNLDLSNGYLVITSTDGRVVRELSFESAPGLNEVTIAVKNLAPGIYFYTVITKLGNFSGRIIKE